MQKIDISVLIPVYNVEKYIEECIRSILVQTFKGRIEIICINDQSTDSSLEILNNLAKEYSNIIIVTPEKKVYQGGARNIGINLSKGKYISFIDSDDYVNENLYEKVYNIAEEKNLDIVEFGYLRFKDGDKIISDEKKFFERRSINIKVENVLLETGSVCSKLYNSEIIKGKIYFPENLYYEDNYFVYSLLLSVKKIEKIEDIFYYYRCNLNSTTQKRNDFKFYDRLITAQMFIDYSKKIGKYLEYKEEIDYIFYKLFFYNTIVISASFFDKIQLKKVREIRKDYLKNDINIQENKYYLQDININGLEKILKKNIINFPNIIYLILFIKSKLLRIVKRKK